MAATAGAPPGAASTVGAPPGAHRVVIVGGGFGGLNAAKGLGRDDRIDVTLVDRRNFHLFQPLLYQVATGALSPGEIAQPLRSILRRDENTTVLLGEAVTIDPERRELVMADGGPIGYDTLIVATGARHSYFGNDEWARLAPGLKSFEDALEIRRRILIAFEAAEREADLERRAAWLGFVIVGGGPTGVELAGALGEIAHDTLRRDFRTIDPATARITLCEALDRILPTYPASMSRSAARQLERLHVTVRTATKVTAIDEEGVTVSAAAASDATGAAAAATRAGERPELPDRIPAKTVLWAAGVQVSSFSRRVAEALGAEMDRAGRILVGPDLAIPGHPEVIVVGDAAVGPWKPGRPVPGVAQGAIQGGKYAALAVRRRLSGERSQPFRFSDRGDVAVIGRLAGVTNIGWLGPFGRQSGLLAWALWLGIHLVYLIGFSNRIVVLVRWFWSFITHGRSSRLITGQPLLPDIEEPEPPA